MARTQPRPRVVAALLTVPFVVVVLVLLLAHTPTEDQQSWSHPGSVDESQIFQEPPAETLLAQWKRPLRYRRTGPRRKTDTSRSLLADPNEISVYPETFWMAHLFQKSDERIQQHNDLGGDIQPRIVLGQDVRTKETQTRIVGGRDVDAISRFPSFVFTAGTQLCGGTLIHEDIVLTAAHCVNAFTDGIIVGSQQIDGTGGFFAAITLEYPHPEYNPETDENDIMLVLLSKPVADVPLQTLNMDQSIPADGENVTVIGFGFTSEEGALADTLQEVQVNVVDFETCNEYFGRIVDDIMVCAGTGGSGRDSCQGDSGGPLLTDQGIQVGLVSFGLGCGRPDVPAAVYARVSGFDRFIEGGICDLSSNPPASCANSTTAPAVLRNSTAAPNASPAPSITGTTLTGSPSPADSRTAAPAFISIPTTANDTAPSVGPNFATPVSSQAPSAAGTLVTTVPTSAVGSESPAPLLLSPVPTFTEGSGPTAEPSTQGSAPLAPTATPSEQSRSPNLAVVNSPTIASQPTAQTIPLVPSGNSSPTIGPTVFRFGGGTSPPTDGPTLQPTIAPTKFRFGGETAPPTDALLSSTIPTVTRSRNPTRYPQVDIPSLIYGTNSPASPSNPARPIFDRLTQAPAPVYRPSPPQKDIPNLITGTKSPVKSPRPKSPHLDIPSLIYGTISPASPSNPTRPVFDRLTQPPAPVFSPSPPQIDIPYLITGSKSPVKSPRPKSPHLDIPTLIFG